MIAQCSWGTSQHTMGINCVPEDSGLPSPVSPVRDNYHWASTTNDQRSQEPGKQPLDRSDTQLQASAAPLAIHDNTFEYIEGHGPIPHILPSPSSVRPDMTASGHPYSAYDNLFNRSSGQSHHPDAYQSYPSPDSTGIDSGTMANSITDGSIECLWSPRCNERIPSSSVAAISKHLKEKHYHGAWRANNTVECRWDDCSWSKLLQLASLGKHIASRHVMSTRVACPDCGVYLSRSDSLLRHADKCPLKTPAP